MPWHFIMMPFWVFPLAAWLIILFEIAPKEAVIMTTGACVMTGAPILALVFFLCFLPRYREAKLRAKREAKARAEIQKEINRMPSQSEGNYTSDIVGDVKAANENN